MTKAIEQLTATQRAALEWMEVRANILALKTGEIFNFSLGGQVFAVLMQEDVEAIHKDRDALQSAVAKVERLTAALQAIVIADEIAYTDDQEVDLVNGIADRALKGESYDDLIEEMKRENAEGTTDSGR